jgi:hypothetical protein
MVVGARPRRLPGCRWNSCDGRSISNCFVWLASGVRVDDSQSGLRSYPLAATEALGVRAGRFGFETEALTRAGWAGLRVVETPVSCVYEVEGRPSCTFGHERCTAHEERSGDCVVDAVARRGLPADVSRHRLHLVRASDTAWRESGE